MRRKINRLKDVSSEFVNKLLKCSSTRPSLGSDPEFFVADAKDKILAADKFFPGKKEPLRFDADHKNLSLFFDGIQAEINVPASTCRETVSHYIRNGLRKATEIIGKNNKIIMRPSVRVTKSLLKKADPEALIFGCEPDFNAYTGKQNTEAMDASAHMYRYAGGHIHLGVSSAYGKKGQVEYDLAKTEEGHVKAIKFIDYLTGAVLVMMDKGPNAKRRRTKYGTAGCFRPTPYGIEYRTPSCWWLKSPAAMSLTFGLTRLAWNLLISRCDEELIKHVGYSLEDVRGIVDENDTVVAKRFWKTIRPYIAVSSKGVHNPLHIKSIRTPLGGYIRSVKEGLDLINEHKMPKLHGGAGAPVCALAAFEYMIKHGSDLLITDNVSEEWSLNSRNKFFNTNGFVNGMYAKLNDNADFKKFQKDFITHIL